MIILLATEQNALSPIWNASVLLQMSFHFGTSFLNPDEVMQERFKIHSTVQQSTKTTQWTVNRLTDQTTSDQSNQSPG